MIFNSFQQSNKQILTHIPFIQKNGIPFNMNDDTLSAMVYLISRHPSIIQNTTL